MAVPLCHQYLQKYVNQKGSAAILAVKRSTNVTTDLIWFSNRGQTLPEVQGGGAGNPIHEGRGVMWEIHLMEVIQVNCRANLGWESSQGH